MGLGTAAVLIGSAAGIGKERAGLLSEFPGPTGGLPSAADDHRCVMTDPPATALNATQVIWRFFAAHPKVTR